MVLTYNGSAVATLTRIERETTAVINGETVTGTLRAYRTNTFPPRLKDEMVVSDLEKMLEARGRIRACGSDPALVSACMVYIFSAPENVRKLKIAMDGKIQAKESTRRLTPDMAPKKSPKQLYPR